MRLRFMESGGFAGLTRGCELSTDALPANLAPLAAELARRPAGSRPENRGARDDVSYELELSSNEDHVKVAYAAADLPERFEPLVEYLSSISKPTPLR